MTYRKKYYIISINQQEEKDEKSFCFIFSFSYDYLNAYHVSFVFFERWFGKYILANGKKVFCLWWKSYKKMERWTMVLQ